MDTPDRAQRSLDDRPRPIAASRRALSCPRTRPPTARQVPSRRVGDPKQTRQRGGGRRKPDAGPADGTRASSVLSTRETSTLLRLLQSHQIHLEHAHADAKRLAHAGVRPAYLVDFQMIYWYMFETLDSPQDVMMLEYLFGLDEVDFILGPGTLIELDSFLRSSARFELLPDVNVAEVSLLDLRSIWFKIRDRFEEVQGAGSKLVFAWSRLRDLLSRRNFYQYAENLEHIENQRLLPDKDAATAVRGALQSIRGRRPLQNDADALNFASVVTLRKLASDGLVSYFPYLLTATPSLLNEEHWAFDPLAKWGLTTSVTCVPDSALYTEVLLASYQGESGKAADHSGHLSHHASDLVHGLRQSDAYRDLATDELPPLDTSRIDELDISPASRQLLESVIHFFADPVVREAQRITENVDHSAANWARQELDAQDALRSPRKLLDLLKTVLRALDQSRAGVKVADLWSTLIERVEYSSSESVVAIYCDTDGPRTSEYLRVEHHHSADGPFLAVSWPCHVSLDDILAQFSKSFERHRIHQVELLLGTRDGQTLLFDAELPLNFEDLNEGLQDEAAATWLRLRGGPFDLYCDIYGPVRTDPVVGVVGSELDVSHMSEVYHATSARNLSSSWLQAIMTDALLTVNHSHVDVRGTHSLSEEGGA